MCHADILQAPSPGARRPAHRGLRPAAIVVGVAGARLVIVVFCRPETRVVSIESSTQFVYGRARLFASSGHRFAFVFGKQDETDPQATDDRRRGGGDDREGRLELYAGAGGRARSSLPLDGGGFRERERSLEGGGENHVASGRYPPHPNPPPQGGRESAWRFSLFENRSSESRSL